MQHLWQMLRKCQATAETTKKVPGATRRSHETMPGALVEKKIQPWLEILRVIIQIILFIIFVYINLYHSYLYI